MNVLHSTGEVVVLAGAQTYTLKDDEVMLNNVILKKADIEISMVGNDENRTQQTSGTLVVDKTYNVVATLSTDDFSNVGWASDGVDFVATGTTPTVWTNSSIVVNITDSRKQEDVTVGVRRKEGSLVVSICEQASYDKWTIDGSTQTSLGGLVENLNTAIK